MNYCTNCGNKLEKDANICNKCGKILKPGKAKKFPAWIIILIVLLVMIIPILIVTIISYCIFKYIDVNNIDVKKYIEEYVLNEGTVGDTLDTGNLSFSLKDYKIYSHLDIDVDDNNDGDYLILFFDVKNYSNEPVKIDNIYFDGTLDYLNISPIEILYDIDGVSALNGNILPGDIVSGYVAFKVDKDWNNFVFKYNDIFDDGISFKIINKKKMSDA